MTETTPLLAVLHSGTGELPTTAENVTASVLDADDLPPASAEAALGPTKTHPNQRWATTTALLEVHPHGDGFWVRGAHPSVELALTGNSRYGRPNLALGQLVAQGGELPADVQWLLREWSRTHNEITEWVDQLRAYVGDNELRLVVWDDTGFEIPWELLWLGGSNSRGLRPGWLGALVAITRWTTIHDSSPAGLPYSDAATECSGELVAYLIDAMKADEDVLGRLGPVNSVDSPRLLSRLKVCEPPIGLVYVGSHGTEEDTVVRRRLGDLRLTNLADPLAGLAASRSFVFLNACHSGRLLLDKYLGDSLLRGFAEVFLRQGASVVVGTVGAVETSRAREVAREVLDAMTNRDRTQVAVALRDARAKAAAAMPLDCEDQRMLLPFLSTFMYVCYGNACTTLSLATEEEP